MMGQYILMPVEAAEQIKRCYSILFFHMSLCQERILIQNFMVMWLLFVWTASIALSTEYHVSTSALNFSSSIFNDNCDKLSV